MAQKVQKRITHELVVLKTPPEDQRPQAAASTEKNYAQLSNIRNPTSKYEHATPREHDSNKWTKKRLLYAIRRHQKVPKLKSKPKCTKKDPAPKTEVQVSGGPVYAQLNPTLHTETETENHYQPLSKATREKVKDVGKSLAPSNGDKNLQQDINRSNDENPQYKHENCNMLSFLVYWKPIVGIGLVALTIILILLSIDIFNIARGNDNAENHKELSGSVATTSTTLAEQIVILQNQLNSSVIDLQAQFNSSLQASEALINQRILTLQHYLTSLRQQQRTTLQEVTDLQSDVNIIRSTVNNLDSSVSRLDSRLNGINSDVNGLVSTVNRLSTQLRATTSRLDNKVGILSQNNMMLNTSLLHLNTLAVPIGCNSQVYTTARVNATRTLSPVYYGSRSAQQSIKCEVAVYPAGSVPTGHTVRSTLTRLLYGRLQCDCNWLSPRGQHYNTSLACSMVVTTC